MNNNSRIEITSADKLPLILCFLVDLIIYFFGAWIWLYSLLLVLGGLISYTLFPLLMSISIIIINFIFIFPSLLFLWKNPGSSVGRLLFGYKLVNNDPTNQSITKLFIHDFILHSLLFIVLFNYTNGLVIILFSIILLLFYLIPKKKPLLALLTGTMFVKCEPVNGITTYIFGKK